MVSDDADDCENCRCLVNLIWHRTVAIAAAETAVALAAAS
jgi:hypothetical protein